MLNPTYSLAKSHIWFNDDLTEQQANERRDLCALAAYARSKEKEANVKSEILVLNKQKYMYEDLFKQPPDITLLHAKTLYILDNTVVVFQPVLLQHCV